MNPPPEIADGPSESILEEDRRLIVLGAVVVPSRAPALLSRLETSNAAALRQEATRVAAGSRRARLEALAVHAMPRHGRQVRRLAEAMAACERPRTAAALRDVLEGVAPNEVTRAFRRLVRERMFAISG